MKMTSAIMGALSLALSMGSAHATQQLVTNGEFTSLSAGPGQLTTNTVATGWTVPSGGYTFIFTQGDVASPGQYGGLSLWDGNNGGNNTWNGLSANGGNFAAIDGDFQNQPLTQTISGLTAGNTYDLTFNYAFGQQYGFNGATVQSLTVDVGSTTWGSGNYNVADHGFTGWQSGDVKFTASSASEILSFIAVGNLPVPPFALVSNVSLAVPELSTWAMMLAGFAGLGFAGYRRRAKNGAVA
jgi:hypothetical protein